MFDFRIKQYLVDNFQDKIFRRKIVRQELQQSAHFSMYQHTKLCAIFVGQRWYE